LDQAEDCAILIEIKTPRPVPRHPALAKLRKLRGRIMSKAEMIVLAGIIGAFALFVVGLAWVDFTTRRG
jgi:hypothetical protein